MYALISSNIDRFSYLLFHCQNQENIRNNTITKDPITHNHNHNHNPQLILWPPTARTMTHYNVQFKSAIPEPAIQ